MAITQDQRIIAVNNGYNAAITERTRTTKSGTAQRFTLDIQQDAVGIVVDEIALAKDVAKAIASAVAEGIKSIGATVKTSTLLRRKSAAVAFAKNEPWATQRYNPKGNRMGPRAPGTVSGGKMFNDSGRMAESVTSTPTRDGTYTINVAKGRLDPNQFGVNPKAPYTFEQMAARLFELVDVLRDPSQLVQHPAVQAAMDTTAARMATKLGKGAFQLGRALSDAMNKFEEVGETLEEQQ